MLKKRVIPMLLLSKGRMVKGQKFSNFVDTGDPVSAAKIYNAQNADELVFLDIDSNRGGSDFNKLLDTVRSVSSECFMPLTVGGGVDSIDKINQLLHAGADKVVITTAAINNPKLIREAANSFGRQCIVVGVDVKKEGDGKYHVHKNCGQEVTDIDFVSYIESMSSLGAGEFLINSIDCDGMMTGYDLDTIRKIQEHTIRPLIVAGGAGNFSHLVDAFKVDGVHGVACASIFHFGDNNPIRARSFLINASIPMKLTK